MKLWSFLVVSAVLIESAVGTVDPYWTAYLEETLSEDERQYLFKWALEIDELQGTTTVEPPTTVDGKKRRRVAVHSHMIDLEIADAMSANIFIRDQELLERLSLVFPGHTETLESVLRRKHRIASIFCVPEWLHRELMTTKEQVSPPSRALLHHIASRVSANDLYQLRTPKGLIRTVAAWGQLVIPAVRAWTERSPAPFSVFNSTVDGRLRKWFLAPPEIAQRYLRNVVVAIRAKIDA
jgi:hypothetical protein